MDKRIEYLDIAKGILIITVILSHSPWEFAQYMYWFHMPAFFMISGLLYRDRIDIKRQLLKFYVPYFGFAVIDILFNFIIDPGTGSVKNFATAFISYIYSGKAVWGVFWFIPVLFISKIIFSRLRSHFKTPYIVLIIAIGYVYAHIYSIRVIPDFIVDIDRQYWLPLDIDVVPLALAYYAIGFYSKNVLKYLVTKSAMFFSGVTCMFLFYINFSRGIYFYMNMKDSYYKEIGWDLVFPICFTIFILAVSNNITRVYLRKFLSYCGSNSLIIMYLHRPIGNLLLSRASSVGWIGFTLSGLIGALVFSFIISKSSITTMLFKGGVPKCDLDLLVNCNTRVLNS